MQCHVKCVRRIAGGLSSISQYLLGLDFAAEPDYNLLRSHVASLAATAADDQARPSSLPHNHMYLL